MCVCIICVCVCLKSLAIWVHSDSFKSYTIPFPPLTVGPLLIKVFQFLISCHIHICIYIYIYDRNIFVILALAE